MMRTLPFLTLILATPALADEFPAGPGHDLAAAACTQCHGAEAITGQRLSRDGWAEIVARMVANGAQVSEADQPKIVDYLATSFPAK